MSTEEIRALTRALDTGADPGPSVAAYYRRAATAAPAEQETMLRALDEVIRSYSCEQVGMVAVLAGAIVEQGAAPHAFPGSVFDRLLEQLATIQSEEDETELPNCYYELERAAMACLSRSAELRHSLPQKPALLAALRRYSERYGFVGKMLQVLDEESLIVLHPATERGFRFVIGGIADNFQLHTLLLAALAGKGPERIPGRRPDEDVIAAASDGDIDCDGHGWSSWQLVNWFGLRPGGHIAGQDSTDSWIWNEGVPADIVPFNGTRIVLVGPSTIERSWDAPRVFPGMAGRLEPLGVLEPSEAKRLLAEMLAARPE